MLDKNCTDCLEKSGSEVKLFLLQFKTLNEKLKSVLTEADGTAGVFCINEGCDANYTKVMPARPKQKSRSNSKSK